VKFLALIYSEESAWDSLSDADRSSMIEQYMAFSRDAEAAGVALGGAELAPTRSATTVRVREGQTAVTDGPYAEAKEALGGYYLFECESFDEALDWSARIPGAKHGAIEVRPVHEGEDNSAELVADKEGVAS
jgi:hypothetical protein